MWERTTKGSYLEYNYNKGNNINQQYKKLQKENIQGYQIQHRQAVHQLQATSQVNQEAHNLKQGQENKTQRHQS